MTYDKNSFLAGIAVGRQLKGWVTAAGADIASTFSLQLATNGFTKMVVYGPDNGTTEVDLSDFVDYKTVTIYDSDNSSYRTYEFYPTYVKLHGVLNTARSYEWRIGIQRNSCMCPAPINGTYKILRTPAISTNIPPSGTTNYYSEQSYSITKGRNIFVQNWYGYFYVNSTGTLDRFAYYPTIEVSV